MSGTQALHVMVADIKQRELASMGCKTAEQLKKLGFQIGHFAIMPVDAVVQYVDVFTSAALVDTFVTSAQDALLIAGTPAAAVLGLTPMRVEKCQGEPDIAAQVFRSLPPQALATFTTAQPLLDAQMNADHLAIA